MLNFIATWLLLVLIFLVCSIVSFTVMAEDAYISFRYAENLASGAGPVFNEGGGAVEGYSNPLWVWLIALFAKYGFNSVNVSRCLGLLFGCLTLLEVMLLFRTRFGYGFAAGLVMATSTPFLFWSQTGLESGMFIFLLILSWRVVVQEMSSRSGGIWSILPIVLLLLTRPEGIIYFIIFWAWLINNNGNNRNKSGNIRLVLWATAVILPFLVFILWRHATFDSWLPNTFFAKVNNGLRHKAMVGSWYLLGFMMHTIWLPILVPIMARLLRKNPLSKQASGHLRLIGLLTLAQLVFILYVGGDIHPNDRFCIPFILFSTAATIILLSDGDLFGRSGKPLVWLTILLLIGNLAYSFPMDRDIQPPISRPPNFLAANLAGILSGRISPGEILNGFANPKWDALDVVGNDLRQEENGGLLATDQCGKIPYRSQRPTLDLFGLNDPQVAQIIHSNLPWENLAIEILERAPETFVVFYRHREGHLVAPYHLENTILSEPFGDRYSLDAVYIVDYTLTDNISHRHTFTHQLLRFESIVSRERLERPLTESERKWFVENQPIIDTPDALKEMVDAFIEENAGDERKVVRWSIDLN